MHHVYSKARIAHICSAVEWRCSHLGIYYIKYYNLGQAKKNVSFSGHFLKKKTDERGRFFSPKTDEATFICSKHNEAYFFFILGIKMLLGIRMPLFLFWHLKK